MAAKNKQKIGKKYYVFSELFDSSRIPGDMKEFLQREAATYRRILPVEETKMQNMKNTRERVISVKKIIVKNVDGEEEEQEIELEEYDQDSHRYFFIPKDLAEIEDFVDMLGLEVGVNTYDPNNSNHDGMEPWLEEQLGIPLPTEPCVVMNIFDSHLIFQGMEMKDEI